ncbi:MAG: ABC transporter permease [Gammaproteobacteria bacterium]|nr:ABC transporter permease [Gammaproteobacteria bacterium]|tara:strand:+ start:1793 stop:2650 length:858 start_codon:yes stop_codon:yes gene_type:complete
MNEVMKSSNLWIDALHRLFANKLALFGASFVIILILLALLTPLIAPYEYDFQNRALSASGPSASHLLGTDYLGRDLLTRMLYGSRISLMVGFIATAVALIIGVSWGIIAGYLGGSVDAWMMRIVDALYGIPFIILIILLMVVFGRNLILMFMAIGAVEWLTMARIVRAQVTSLKRTEFVLSAQAMGVKEISIMTRHLLPNTLGPVIVYATLTVPQVMLLEAFLSFLGLGVQAPMSSWGLLIRDGAVSMEESWWLLVFPAGVFSMTLFSLNFLGDGLRDALDPRSV